jgi:hypothetical protein
MTDAVTIGIASLRPEEGSDDMIYEGQIIMELAFGVGGKN